MGKKYDYYYNSQNRNYDYYDYVVAENGKIYKLGRYNAYTIPLFEGAGGVAGGTLGYIVNNSAGVAAGAKAGAEGGRALDSRWLTFQSGQALQPRKKVFSSNPGAKNYIPKIVNEYNHRSGSLPGHVFGSNPGLGGHSSKKKDIGWKKRPMHHNHEWDRDW